MISSPIQDTKIHYEIVHIKVKYTYLDLQYS